MVYATGSKIELKIKALATYPYPCPNCDKPVQKKPLFCCDLCRTEAKFVRYFRGCLADGRYKQDDVKEALRIRLAHILSGGYREKIRQIPKETRKLVFDRDNGLCKCGKKGTQIDHIHDDCNKPENLQTICILCHIQKTRKRFVKFTKESHPELWEKRKNLLIRVFSPQPLRLCDSIKWKNLWNILKKERYKSYRRNQ